MAAMKKGKKPFEGSPRDRMMDKKYKVAEDSPADRAMDRTKKAPPKGLSKVCKKK